MKTTKRAPKFKQIKKVTPKVLRTIADRIHKTRKNGDVDFMFLCNGKLQSNCLLSTKTGNPKDARPMHCGLGELYFEITGREPHQDDVDEEGVIALVVKRSGLPDADELRDAQVAAVRAALKKVNVTEETRQAAESAVEDRDYEDPAELLDECLQEIPSSNDDTANYVDRAAKVAGRLREAADIIETWQ